MASDEIPRGFFVTTGEFTEEAARFAQGKKMTLVDGSSLLADINALPNRTARRSCNRSPRVTTPHPLALGAM